MHKILFDYDIEPIYQSTELATLNDRTTCTFRCQNRPANRKTENVDFRRSHLGDAVFQIGIRENSPSSSPCLSSQPHQMTLLPRHLPGSLVSGKLPPKPTTSPWYLDYCRRI